MSVNSQVSMVAKDEWGLRNGVHAKNYDTVGKVKVKVQSAQRILKSYTSKYTLRKLICCTVIFGSLQFALLGFLLVILVLFLLKGIKHYEVNSELREDLKFVEMQTPYVAVTGKVLADGDSIKSKYKESLEGVIHSLEIKEHKIVWNAGLETW